MLSEKPEISRRGLIRGIGALIAAPAIVRVASLMPVRSLAKELPDRIIVCGDAFFDQLVRNTMRLRSRQLAANVLKNNALMQRLLTAS